VSKAARSRTAEWLFYWPLEASFFWLGTAFLRLLPVDWASALGGAVARFLGPRLAVNERALANLRLVFPELSAERHREIAVAMWDNLGRVAAEYALLDRITDPAAGRVELVGTERIRSLGSGGRAGILISAHLGNWEILPVMAARLGLEMTGVAREPNNPLVRPLLRRRRGVAGGRLVNKGSEGARQAISVLRADGLLAFLADQKMNDGIAVPLFGHDAMTPAAPAQLALRFDCPVVPVRVERLEGARFRIVCDAPLEVGRTGDRVADTRALMRRYHERLEAWIRERPAQWLWLHRRWPKALYQSISRSRSEPGSGSGSAPTA
jgi:KDO2-lipid IV(A) lauroyltransferase